MTDAVKRPSAISDLSEGMSYLDTLPRRLVTVYIPLTVFIVVLLFPFYWMGVTTFKPNEELYNFSDHNPFWISSPTLDNIRKLLFETDYPQWLLNTMTIAACATFLSIFASVLAAYAITRLRFRGAQIVGLLIFLAYLVPPSILFIPLATLVYGLGHLRYQLGSNPHLPDLSHTVLHVATDGILQKYSV